MANTKLTPTKLIERGKWNDYRDEIWGDSYNWSWVRAWSQIEGILIHHSVTKHEATPDDIALLHKARGWAGIGYHFVITKDGTVYYVGDISTARAHVAEKNEKFLGICLVGDFTKHLPSDDQIMSAHDLCSYFWTSVPAIPTLHSWDQLEGHKDEQATQCPGSSWPNDMRQRIIDRRIYSAIVPPVIVPPVVIPPVQSDVRLLLLDQAGINDESKTRSAIERYNRWPQMLTDLENARKEIDSLKLGSANLKVRIKNAVNNAIDSTN